jgi:hypothetical protein
MAYELYIYPPNDVTPSATPQAVTDALTAAGLPNKQQPDKMAHWLVLEGFESALAVTIQEGIVTGANFRFASDDDLSLVERIVDVFKGLGFAVSDEDGEL